MAKYISIDESHEIQEVTLKNIFARVPKELRDDFDHIVVRLEKKSVYWGVERAIRLLIEHAKAKNPDLKLPSEVRCRSASTPKP